MSTAQENDDHRRHQAEQGEAHDRRARTREFSAPNEFVAPKRCVTVLRHLNAAALGTKAERDAFADAMLQKEREYQEGMAGLPDNKPTPTDINRMAAIDDERRTEGRCHVNTRPQTHE